MLRTERWIQNLLGKITQKNFQIMDPNGGQGQNEIEISIMPNAAADSSAEQTGWTVNVNYALAPEIVLFTKTFPAEETATQVMEDFAKVAAEVQGLIRQEKFEDAGKKTKELLAKFGANSEQVPTQIPEGGQ